MVFKNERVLNMRKLTPKAVMGVMVAIVILTGTIAFNAESAMAEDTAETTEVTFYVKAPEEWNLVSIWAWSDNGDLFELWPGEAMMYCGNNEGWYKATIAVEGNINVIFNNPGLDVQTVDINDVAPGTYWYELNPADGEDRYTVSTIDRPEDWADEEKYMLETVDPNEDPGEGDFDDIMPDEEGDAADAPAFDATDVLPFVMVMATAMAVMVTIVTSTGRKEQTD